jgi:hypothetical protein
VRADDVAGRVFLVAQAQRTPIRGDRDHIRPEAGQARIRIADLLLILVERANVNLRIDPGAEALRPQDRRQQIDHGAAQQGDPAAPAKGRFRLLAALRQQPGGIAQGTRRSAGLHASASGYQTWSGCPAANRLRAEASITRRAPRRRPSRAGSVALAASSERPHASSSAARNQQPQSPRADSSRAAKSSAAAGIAGRNGSRQVLQSGQIRGRQTASREPANSSNSEALAAE